MNETEPNLRIRRRLQSTEKHDPSIPEEVREKEKSKKIDFKKFTVLVVDDEADLRDAIVYDFKRRGFTVLSAVSGASAYRQIEVQTVDIVVSDVRMPEGDGTFLLEKIRASGRKIPVILVTGFTDHTEQELLAKGAVKVFAKPFDRKALMRAVIDILADSPRT
jgi:two-component system, NtrC family, response regulator GlrR